MENLELVYKTKTTPFFPICLASVVYTKNFRDLIDENLTCGEPILAIVNDGFVNWFASKKLAPITEIVFARLFSHPKYLQNIYRQQETIHQQMMTEIGGSIDKLFDGSKLNQKGEKKINTIYQLYIDYVYYLDLCGFLFQLYYVQNFKQIIFKNSRLGQAEKDRLYNLILSTPRKTNYELFLTDIYQVLEREQSDIEIEKIVKKYYWLVHDYLGDIINIDYIKKIIREDSKSEIKQTIDDAEKRIIEITEIKKQFSPEIQQKIEVVQKILYLYNEEKKITLSPVNIYIRRIFERKFLGINLNQLKIYYQLAPKEIIALLKNEKVENIEQRDKRWIYKITNGEIKNGEEKFFQLIELDKEVKELKGNIACIGKVKGTVSVVLNISQITKFKKGEILVAPFTNVNYLPIMRKALAIITETGGLTSHAAIISRELNIPSIVGVKNLLSKVSDGDIVEVDADNGTVKIL